MPVITLSDKVVDKVSRTQFFQYAGEPLGNALARYHLSDRCGNPDCDQPLPKVGVMWDPKEGWFCSDVCCLYLGEMRRFPTREKARRYFRRQINLSKRMKSVFGLYPAFLSMATEHKGRNQMYRARRT